MLSTLLSIDHQLGNPLAMTVGGTLMAARGLQNCFNGYLKTGITQIAVGTLSAFWGTYQLNQLNNNRVSAELEIAKIRSQAERADACSETTSKEIETACQKSFYHEYEQGINRGYVREIRAVSDFTSWGFRKWDCFVYLRFDKVPDGYHAKYEYRTDPQGGCPFKATVLQEKLG